MSDTISLNVEFRGGLELLFDKQPKHSVEIARAIDGRAATLTDLILWLKSHRLRERPELFVEEQTVRPGILVLVNDVDWELEGEGSYELKEGDEIIFLSTLHGG